MDAIANPDGTVSILGSPREITHLDINLRGPIQVILTGEAARHLTGMLPHTVEHIPEGEAVSGDGHDGRGEAIDYIAGMQRSMSQALEAIREAQKLIDTLDPGDADQHVPNDLAHAVQVLTDARSYGDLVVEAIRDGTACEGP